jgi:hypothetical protein
MLEGRETIASNTGRSSLTISAKPLGGGGASRPSILAGEHGAELRRASRIVNALPKGR